MKALVAVSLLLFGSAALAQTQSPQAGLINPDRPGIADGSAVVGRGIFQIEAGLERDHDAGDRSIATPLLLRYGVNKAFEMRVEGNGYVHAKAGAASRRCRSVRSTTSSMLPRWGSSRAFFLRRGRARNARTPRPAISAWPPISTSARSGR